MKDCLDAHPLHYILASDLTKRVRREAKGSAAQLKSKKRKQEQEAGAVMGVKNLKLEEVTMEDIFEELRLKADELKRMEENGQLTLYQKHSFLNQLRNITI